MADAQGPESDADEVVQPPSPSAFPPVPRLAPPMGEWSSTPPPHVDVPPAAPIPQAAPRSGPRGIVLIVVGAFVAIVMTAAIVVATLAAAPRVEPIVAPPSEVAADPSEVAGDPSEAPDDPLGATSANIADRLQAKIDEYRRLRDTGELWEKIPDSEYSRTAVAAFVYFLTDMKLATIFGVDDAQAAEYDDRMAELERLLLEQQPLGDDIHITFEDGTMFTYDGETGEGGYTQE